jgi:hypothetical protein
MVLYTLKLKRTGIYLKLTGMKNISLEQGKWILFIILLLLMSPVISAQEHTLQGIQFQPITVKNLPDAVQRAVLDNHTNAVIVAAAEGVLTNGERIYRVNYTGTAAGEQTTIYYANGTLFQGEEPRGLETDDDPEEETDEDDLQQDADLDEDDGDDADAIRFRQP